MKKMTIKLELQCMKDNSKESWVKSQNGRLFVTHTHNNNSNYNKGIVPLEYEKSSLIQ